MVRTALYKECLAAISAKEQEVSMVLVSVIEQSVTMIKHLRNILDKLRHHIERTTLLPQQEIEFFKLVKPQVLGKLIFYNEVYRIETACPVMGGKLYRKYYSSQLKLLKRKGLLKIDADFYRYYRSGRSDGDELFFTRGKLRCTAGLDSICFEADPRFSTYYDHLVAQFVAQELLYAFLVGRVDPENPPISDYATSLEALEWTGTKNALIELIYALYSTGVISNGKAGLRRITTIFQWLFKIPLGDIHHAFHRMKDRAGNRTLFLDQLKDCLEHYMDKNL